MQSVPLDLLEFDGDFFHAALNGVPFTGVAHETLLDGSLISESTYKGGMMHGRCREWLPSGQLIHDSSWKYHARHGPCRQWYPNGGKKQYEYFKRGVLIRSLQWDEQGQLIRDFRLDERYPDYAWVCQKLAEEPDEPNDIWAGVDDNMEIG